MRLPQDDQSCALPHIFCQLSCSSQCWEALTPRQLRSKAPGAALALPSSGTAPTEIVCRVSFARIEGKSFRVSALCSTGGRRFGESGRVTSAGGNRYTGWVFNEQFNERRNVQLSQRGSRLSVTVTSSRGIANLTLSRG